jgi:hypothetical protein
LVRRIEEWLGDLGLGEHAPRFVENGIDLSALPYLTDADLKELGVLLGHRRRLMAAIAKVDVAPSAAVPMLSGSSPSTPVGINRIRDAEIPDARGERRYLTVLFCDLVDSAGIASRLDAEE